MFNIISKFMFIIFLILGTLIVFSSTSWLGMWMGLELNLLSFIPLITSTNNSNSSESSIKYFLIQTLASLTFLFVIIINVIKMSFFNFFYNYENLIINSAMMLKLGAAPLHFWFPNIINGLSWINILTLLTWQKFAPLSIIAYTNHNMIIIFILSSAFIGALGGLNQTSLSKILAFSSINHMSWILISEFYCNSLWLFYFLIYSIMNFSIILILKILNFTHLNQIFILSNFKFIIKFCLFFNFLSLGGLPPFLGFLPKWMIMENLLQLNLIFLLFFMIMMTLITLFFYIRLTYSAFLLSYPNFPWKMNFFKKKNIMFFIILSNFNNIILFGVLLMNNYFIY